MKPMISEHNITSLLSQWEKRLQDDSYSEDYRCALGECLHDLQEALARMREEEEACLEDVIANLPSEEEEDYLRGLEADKEASLSHKHNVA